MTMLDQNRALTQIAQKAQVPVTGVKKLAIWGNHSTTMYPDFYNASVSSQPLTNVVKDENWLKTTFLETVQKRGAEIIKARGASSAASAANAVVDTVRNILTPTASGDFYSVAVCSDGSYGIEKGLLFSYPIRTTSQGWEIVKGLELNAFSQTKIKETEKELIEERDAVKSLVS
jgi:malate dehydrogenase